MGRLSKSLLGLLQFLAPGFIALVLALGSLWLFTRNNNYPPGYQPDEESKADQIMSPDQKRNFSHPLLMLESANLVRKWFDVPNDMRAMLIAGRSTSAGLAAIGVMALALAAYSAHGYRGLLLGGLVMGLCPPLLAYAHYFKEDAPLAAGIAVAVLGAAWVVNTSSPWKQVIGILVLGFGCAAAASGKYVGAMVFPACLLAACIPSNRRWIARVMFVLLFLLATASSFIFINARGFAHYFPPQPSQEALDGFKFEYNHGTTGHLGVALPTPNAFCIDVGLNELMPHLWVFLELGLAALILRRKITRWGIVLAAFLICQVVFLSFNAIPFGRYALPLTITLYFLAADMMLAGLSTLNRRWMIAGLTACIAVVVILQGRKCLNFNGQFLDDSRERARQWIAKNIPTGSQVVAERYTGLDGRGDPVRFPDELTPQLSLRVHLFVPDENQSVDQLAWQGVQYVVVADESYERFFVPGIRALADMQDFFDWHRRFYADLFARGQLVWRTAPDPPTHSFVNPEIRVYRISQLLDSQKK